MRLDGERPDERKAPSTSTGNLNAGNLVDLQASSTPEGRKEGEASPTIPSWNQILEALRDLDLLRQAVAA
jgi:hypothetical protein